MNYLKLILVALAVTLVLPLGASAQSAGPVIINQINTTSPGQSVSVSTSSATQILLGCGQGSPICQQFRQAFCFICTVPVNFEYGYPNNNAPLLEPTSSIGLPVAASTYWCDGPYNPILASPTSRVDVISTSGSGTCATIEAMK